MLWGSSQDHWEGWRTRLRGLTAGSQPKAPPLQLAWLSHPSPDTDHCPLPLAPQLPLEPGCCRLSHCTESVTSSHSNSRTNASDWPSQGYVLERWLPGNSESKHLLFPLLWRSQVLLLTKTPKVENSLHQIQKGCYHTESKEKRRWVATILVCSKCFDQVLLPIKISELHS